MTRSNSTAKKLVGRQVWSQSKLLSMDWHEAIRHLALLTLFYASCSGSALAQQSDPAPVVIQPPVADVLDENFVSILSGKEQFTIPALKFGEVSFTPYTYNGGHFQPGGIIDQNYGKVGLCSTLAGGSGYGGTYDCAVRWGDAIQAQLGQENARFRYSGGQYTPVAADGSTFVDNVNADGTCTWTKRDGTTVVYIAYHATGNPLCLSQNIKKIIYPDGRIATYTYPAGQLSTSWYSPILSITTNTGYMLKYNYPSTPTWGAETSVVAFNRAFESCDPAAVSCTLSGSWPTATLSWGPGFTIEEATHKKHVFQLDSSNRVIAYQPPGATSFVYYYTLCSFGGTTLYNCGGINAWHYYQQPDVTYAYQVLDMVSSVTRNGQTWGYGATIGPYGGCGSQPFSTWAYTVTTPLNKMRHSQGSSSPGFESCMGPIDSITSYDGTSYAYTRDEINRPYASTSPSGIRKVYLYDSRGNVTQVTQYPPSGNSLPAIVQQASYPEPNAYPCTNIVTCNKPISVTDPNGNVTDFTYDPVHGGVLTQTQPAAPNGIRPQIRRTYVQRNAWYLNAAATMTRDTDAVWLLATESVCRTGAASGSGCANANDEVLTSYDYGPDSGPNNLLLRGKTVTADGQTIRVCYAHDKQGNKIWETSPNAHPVSCPAY